MRKLTGSLAAKMSLMVVVVIAIVATISTYYGIDRFRTNDKRIWMDYATTVAENAIDTLENAKYGGVEINTSLYQTMFANVKMKGMDTSYLYVCNPDGTLVYHPQEEKIGTKVENDAINEVIAKFAAGQQVEDGGAIYYYNDVRKLTGYAIAPNNDVFVVVVDYNEIMQGNNELRVAMILLNVFTGLGMALLFFFVSKSFFKPVAQICEVIKDTSELNLTRKPYMDKLCKRSDELGQIAGAVDVMTDSLREIVKSIEEVSQIITTNVDDLKDSAENVNNMCTDNSATTEEIASGMQETSATTETIHANIESMIDNAKGIDELAKEGTTLSNEVNKRAEELKATTIEATQRTERIYEDVKVKTEAAIEEARAVDKINEMTNTIMEISSQTSLLALNASIEAARAGESGRGFAVVATEIGSLATQTSQTVANIEEMVKGVIAAVGRMQDCLTETTTFIGENVIQDYRDFGKVSEQYQTDAEEFKKSMLTIRDGIAGLNAVIDQIAESVAGINETVNESAKGVSGMAENTSEIVVLTESTAEMANACKKQIVNLEEIVDSFILG